VFVADFLVCFVSEIRCDSNCLPTVFVMDLIRNFYQIFCMFSFDSIVYNFCILTGFCAKELAIMCHSFRS